MWSAAEFEPAVWSAAEFAPAVESTAESEPATAASDAESDDKTVEVSSAPGWYLSVGVRFLFVRAMASLQQ